jgi:hypothetical protein
VGGWVSERVIGSQMISTLKIPTAKIFEPLLKPGRYKEALVAGRWPGKKLAPLTLSFLNRRKRAAPLRGNRSTIR